RKSTTRCSPARASPAGMKAVFTLGSAISSRRSFSAGVIGGKFARRVRGGRNSAQVPWQCGADRRFQVHLVDHAKSADSRAELGATVRGQEKGSQRQQRERSGYPSSKAKSPVLV